MKLLAASDVWDLAGYERQRDAFRSTIIALKKLRRIPVGPRATLVFENRNTLIFQVHEMLRVERLHEPADVQRELDVYNDLIPGEGELSATLFIEVTDLKQVRPELDRLVGLDEHLFLRIGSQSLPGSFDPKQMEADRISAVQYVRFALDPEARAGLADPATAALVGVDHPHYSAETEIGPETRASLLEDLSGSSDLLLPSPSHEARARDEELFREGAARALRPAHPRQPGHVVVEPIASPVSFLDATPEQQAACAAAIRRVVGELGPCRIESDAGPDTPLRYHLIPEK